MKTIRIEDIPADENARTFLESLDLSEGEIVLERLGGPQLIILSPGILKERRRAKARFFELVDQIHGRNPDLDSDEVLAELEAGCG